MWALQHIHQRKNEAQRRGAEKRKAKPSVCKEARLLKRCECKGRSMVTLRLQTMPQQISARRCSSFVTAWLNSTSLWKNEKKRKGTCLKQSGQRQSGRVRVW